MSWHFSQALQAVFSQAEYSAGEQSAQLSLTGTDGPSWRLARTMAALTPSLSGVISEPSTGSPGEAALTWYREAFPARRTPPLLEAKTSRMISGRKCGESWQRQLPGTYLPRTLQKPQLTPRQMTLKRWVTKPAVLPFPRQTWVRTTFGPDIGFVHTPTTKANYTAASMQKWPSCRAFVRAFGRPSPEVHEWLMGWPEGWSDTKPLVMDRYQSWLQRHGVS